MIQENVKHIIERQALDIVARSVRTADADTQEQEVGNVPDNGTLRAEWRPFAKKISDAG